VTGATHRVVELAGAHLGRPLGALDALRHKDRTQAAHAWAQTLLHSCDGNEQQAAQRLAAAIQRQALLPDPASFPVLT
jgi:hypothetical protein